MGKRQTAFSPTVVITDHWLNAAFTIKWFLLMSWATYGAIVRLPSISNTEAPDYLTLGFSASVAVACLIAFLGALYLKTRLEYYSAIFFVATMAGYFVVCVYGAFTSPTFIIGAIAALTFIVFPIYRVRALGNKLRVQNGLTE